MEINILHLYYDILNLYGEYGNVVIMKKHLEDQGFKVNVDKKTIGDNLEFSKYNFIYMGCGTEKNLDFVLKDISKYAEQINIVIENKIVFLATGNSFEMFGQKIDSEEGLGIFDYETIRLKDRVTSDVIYTLDDSYKIVGFVNKMTEIYHNSNPLFKVEYGIGENKQNDFEGVKYLNFYGTHVIGPLLAKNPELLKLLVIRIAKSVNKDFEYKEIDYPYEEASYKTTLKELEKRKDEG